MNYIAIISVLVILILLLIYISASNKGWNCTENGCEYVSGGFFNSYNKCNSHCKSNSKSSCIVLRPQLPYYHPSLYFQDNHLERKKKHTDSNKNRNENNIIINNSFPTTASK